MYTRSALVLALATATTQAVSISQRDSSDAGSGSGTINYNDPDVYSIDVCLGGDLTNTNLPCVALLAVTTECESGNAYNGSINTGNDKVNARDQQTCFCQSQFFSLVNGCTSCYDKHGLSNVVTGGPNPNSSAIASFSSSYCQYTNTPTAGFEAVFTNAFPTLKPTGHFNPTATTTSVPTFSDPIGNKTDVSYYFTPSVSKEQLTAVPTTGGSTTKISTNTAGQIVATATGKGAAAPTSVVNKLAAAGVVGLGALAFAL
ncbi:hypothetical protein MRB53_041414 [Persea americana]|nr:hypothetical protein MRB53_041414 [Persea americana]